MNPIPLFSRCEIVNLPQRTDRRREMDAELARFSLHADGRRLRYFPAIRPDHAGDFPSLGARGCFLSHLAIIDAAIADGLPDVLVMEDDLAFAPLLAHFPASACEQLALGDWDFAYFGHVHPVGASHSGRVPALQPSTEPLATTHFYALNGRILRPLREHLAACLTRPSGHPLGSPMHVDGAYSLFRAAHPGCVTLIATPSLGHQRSSRSDIFANKWYDRLPGTRHLAAAARQLRNARRSAASQPDATETPDV
jgi:hypothetical protein